MRSIDPPRTRPAPQSFIGRTLDGDQYVHTFDAMTLVVAVKNNCDGCRDFVNSDLAEFDGVEVIVVSAVDDVAGEWRGARQRVVIAPELLRELDVRWPPFYVLVEPRESRVLTEGVVFGPTQVAEEIAAFLVR